MNKKLLLLPLLAISLVGCGETKESQKTQVYDTEWQEVALNYGSFIIYTIKEEVVYSLNPDDYKTFSYRFCAYSNYTELTTKYTLKNASSNTYTDYYCGTNVSYRISQFN